MNRFGLIHETHEHSVGKGFFLRQFSLLMVALHGFHAEFFDVVEVRRVLTSLEWNIAARLPLLLSDSFSAEKYRSVDRLRVPRMYIATIMIYFILDAL